MPTADAIAASGDGDGRVDDVREPGVVCYDRLPCHGTGALYKWYWARGSLFSCFVDDSFSTRGGPGPADAACVMGAAPEEASASVECA